jgi:hypothetical protein
MSDDLPARRKVVAEASCAKCPKDLFRQYGPVTFVRLFARQDAEEFSLRQPGGGVLADPHLIAPGVFRLVQGGVGLTHQGVGRG